MEKISSRLKRLLEAKGINQTELAARSSITQSTVSKYVRGATEPKSRELYAISKALDVSMESWFSGFQNAEDAKARKGSRPAAADEKKKSRAAKRKLKKIRAAVLKIYKDMGDLEGDKAGQ